jgi:hypothetical protein
MSRERDKMPIMVGTLVKRYKYDEDLVGHFPCIEYNADKYYDEDEHRNLDVCLGMVIENIPGEPDVIVTWVHLCSYHRDMGAIAQEGIDYPELWEVGQL